MTLGLIRRHTSQLPVEITGFVGRETELALLAGLLDAARLVTVIGPGGVGKTRVSLRAAAQAAGRFADGVCLVELSGLSDPELLPHTVATALGLPEQDTRSQLDAVLDYLHERQLMLILDTCEHLIDACAMLANIVLQEVPGVTVLATSRQPLDVPGERTCLIPPLPVPEPGTPAIAGGDAVELFAQRAADVVPGFTVTDTNRADIVRLCRRLDGIPLAIELATIRLRAVPLYLLTERLEDRFRVFTGDRRTALPRHQTLKVAIEWSHDLCSSAEQALWARLSVFAGTFDIPAAEDVCSGEGLDREDVLQTLVGLVDKSVVLRIEDTRYRLLDSLREFGAEQLAEHTADVRRRHVARYVVMAQRFGAQFTGSQLAEFRALRRDHANIRAALEYALAMPGGEREALELATGLHGYWVMSGLLSEGNYWLTKILDRFPDPSLERARLLGVRSYVTNFLGEMSSARADAEASIAITDGLGAAPDADAIGARGYVYLHLALTFGGMLDEAAAAGLVAAERLEKSGDTYALCIFDVHMAFMHALAGDLDRCLERCSQGLTRLVGVASGEMWLTSFHHSTAGLALFVAGKAGPSTEAFHRSLEMKHELGDIIGVAYCLEGLAWLAAAAQRYQRAAWLLGAADGLWQLTGNALGGAANLEQFHQQAATAARDGLGADRYAATWSGGSTEPVDRIVELAAADADEMMPAPSADGLSSGPAALLSIRELQIAELVTEGLSNREIAERLVISKRTVDAHIEHIFGKLGLSSRTQLVSWLNTGPSTS